MHMAGTEIPDRRDDPPDTQHPGEALDASCAMIGWCHPGAFVDALAALEDALNDEIQDYCGRMGFSEGELDRATYESPLSESMKSLVWTAIEYLGWGLKALPADRSSRMNALNQIERACRDLGHIVQRVEIAAALGRIRRLEAVAAVALTGAPI